MTPFRLWTDLVPVSETCAQGLCSLGRPRTGFTGLEQPPVRAVKSGIRLGHRCSRAGLSCEKPRMAGYPLGSLHGTSDSLLGHGDRKLSCGVLSLPMRL